MASDEPYLAVIDGLKTLVDAENTSKDALVVNTRASALTGRLKALVRAANTATRTAKDLTASARQDMDQAHLGLQNLMYEKRHLEREIEKCRQFATVYQDIPLHDLEDFKVLAPLEARTDQVLSDEHQLLLNRLSFEFVERQRLEQMQKDLLQQREELYKESKVKAVTSDNVKTQIETLSKVAGEVQKKVNEFVATIPNMDVDTPG
ncbi:unnamed protein product [Mycena citricolor]|uniref:Fms interacting protein n=1 Tax=Mycena citricolor TaxID=2018698 RepID=A0AAD2HGD0_9AGAR|nr:unnamed protein product [Mycena citricolor]